MPKIALEIEMKTDEILQIIRQLSPRERRKIRDFLNAGDGGKSPVEDKEGLLLSKSATFRRIIQSVEQEIERGKTRPLEEVWDEL